MHQNYTGTVHIVVCVQVCTWTYHNSGPADIEEQYNSEEHSDKLCLHPQLELLRDDRSSTLQRLTQITDSEGGRGRGN